MQTEEKLLPTLDIGSHINARPQPRLEAGATQERTLLAVACKPLILIEASPLSIPRWYAGMGNSHALTRRRPQALCQRTAPIVLRYRPAGPDHGPSASSTRAARSWGIALVQFHAR